MKQFCRCFSSMNKIQYVTYWPQRERKGVKLGSKALKNLATISKVKLKCKMTFNK